MTAGFGQKFKITLHPMFVILGIVLIIWGRGDVFFICSISAFFHELGHSVVAGKCGYKMERIRLMPFGAELHGDTDCFDGRDEIYIALAGPLVNFFICLVVLGLWWISPRLYGVTSGVFQTNLVMGCFNLLPLFPLDGGRILLSALSRNMTRRKGARLVKKLTQTFAVILFIAFLLTLFNGVNLSLGIMAFMLFFSASSSANDAVYQKIVLSNLVQTRAVQWVNFSVPKHFLVYQLRQYHIKNRVIVFSVIDEVGTEIFRFSELDLEREGIRISQTQKVGDLKKILSI